MGTAADVKTRVPFAPVRSLRAFEEIEKQIRGLITSQHLKPGDRLPPERELSAQFDVSRNTLREALRNLEISGLLDMRKGSTGGAFISAGRPNVVINGLADLYQLGAISPRELTEARIWIEALVVRVACERAEQQDFDALAASITAASEADKIGDIETRLLESLRFHRLLGLATRNQILAIQMDSLMEVVRRLNIVMGSPVQSFSYIISSRKRLMRHLRCRDANAAEEEMVRHLKRVYRDYLALLDAVHR